MERRTPRGTPYRIARSRGVRGVRAARRSKRHGSRSAVAGLRGAPLLPQWVLVRIGAASKGQSLSPAVSTSGAMATRRVEWSRATVVYGSGSVDESGGVREDGLPIVRRKGRLTMRRRVCGVAAAAVLAGIISAPPALAHGGHASCGEGARAFVVAQAHAGTAGETASAQAREGTLNENVAAAHAIFCEPK